MLKGGAVATENAIYLPQRMERFTQNKYVDRLCKALLICMAAVAWYSFVTTPFTADIKVFFAAADQVQYQSSSGIMAVFEAWELKGIGNRLLMYGIYLVADAVVGFENKIAFTYAAKLLYSVLIMLFLFLSTHLLPIEKKQKPTVLYILFLCFFSVNSLIQLQAEMTCVALCFLSAACLLHGKRFCRILSGFIGACLFFFKSIFVLLFLSVILCAVLYDGYAKRRRGAGPYVTALVSMLIFEILFLLLVYWAYPQEFRDMGYAADYQSTLLSAGSAVQLHTIADNFFAGLLTSTVMLPFLLVGILTGCAVLADMLREKNLSAALCLVGLWVLSLDIIVVSNTYFPYHYFLLMLPGAVCTLLFFAKRKCRAAYVLFCAGAAFCGTAVCWALKKGLQQFSVINHSTVLLVGWHLFVFFAAVYAVRRFRGAQTCLLALLLTVTLFFWMNYSSFVAPYYRNICAAERQATTVNSEAVPQDIGDDKVLYLDAGVGAFYMGAPSYSRYFFNLPMQRFKAGDTWVCQQEQYALLMQYTGKYIVYSDWFGIEKYPQLQQKLETEYERIDGKDLLLYTPSWDVFSLTDVQAMKPGAYILIRK